MTLRCRPGEGRDPYRGIHRSWMVGVPNRKSSPNHCLWLWVPAFAGTTIERQLVARINPGAAR